MRFLRNVGKIKFVRLKIHKQRRISLIRDNDSSAIFDCRLNND